MSECPFFAAKEPLFSPDGPCRAWVPSQFQLPGYCSLNHQTLSCPTQGMRLKPRADQEDDGYPD